MNSWYYGLSPKIDMQISLSQAAKDILDNGYAVIKNSVPLELIDTFLKDYDGLKVSVLDKHKHELDSEDCIEGMYRRLVNLHLKVPSLRPLFTKNQALVTTDFFFKEETTLYTSLYYEIGSAQDLHRDTPYFWTNPGYGYFGVWLALEDAGPENGALEVIPGSHRILDEFDFRDGIGLIEKGSSGSINPQSSNLWDTYQRKVYEKCIAAGLKKEVASVRKGDTVIWHPQLMHGGSKNADRYKSRNSFVMHVTPKNSIVYSQDKYFDPALDEEIASRSPEIKYLSEDGRHLRNDNLWAIAQKIFLPI